MKRNGRPTNVKNWAAIDHDDEHGDGGLAYETDFRVGQRVFKWNDPDVTGHIQEVGGDYLLVVWRDEPCYTQVGLDDVFHYSRKRMRLDRIKEVYEE